MSTPAPSRPAPPVPVTISITLIEPIQREAGPVEVLTLRKPKAGELRGLALKDLINSEVTAVLTVLPRICDPFITEAECALIGSEDVAEIAGTIVGFFMSPADKTEMAQRRGTS